VQIDARKVTQIASTNIPYTGAKGVKYQWHVQFWLQIQGQPLVFKDFWQL